MFGEPVTRRRQQETGTDPYGNPVFDWVDVVLAQTAAFDPGGTREPVEVGREAVVTTPKLYFEEPPDLIEEDRVLVRGDEFAIDGDPADWRDPWGSDVGGLVVELKKVDG